jgi:hypothetical protein
VKQGETPYANLAKSFETLNETMRAFDAAGAKRFRGKA